MTLLLVCATPTWSCFVAVFLKACQVLSKLKIGEFYKMGTAGLNTKSVSALKNTLSVYIKAGREVSVSQLFMEKV